MNVKFEKNIAKVNLGKTNLELKVRYDYNMLKFETINLKKPLDNYELATFLTYAENLCKEEELSILVIDDKLVDFKDNQYMKGNDYRALWDLIDNKNIKKGLPDSYAYGTWAKEVNIGSIEYKTNMIEQIKETLEKIKEKRPTFKFLYSYELVKFHFRGSEDEFRFKVKKEGTEIIDYKRSETYLCKNKEEMEKNIELILEKIEKTQKVKQIFEPNKEYFESYIKKNIIQEKETISELYDKLRKLYSPYEIEDHFAKLGEKKEKKIIKQEFPFKNNKRQLLLTELMGENIIIETLKKGRKITLYGKNEEKAKESLKNRSMEIYEEEITNFKKELDKKIKKY